MSEYQYYEWQTIDRSLTARELGEVNSLSSHMDTVTANRAVVTYSWGDFKHDPRQVLLKYFDAFLYDSNFGLRQLVFRLPKDLADLALFQPYLLDDWIMLETHGKYVLLEIAVNDETHSMEWVESDDFLNEFLPLRDQLLQGDVRLLYLAWLRAVSMDGPAAWEDELEPPVPAGLKHLDSSLEALVKFFDIDHYFLSAAASASPNAKAKPKADLGSALAKLSRDESDQHLKAILQGESDAVITLKKRLAQLSGQQSPARAEPTRTGGELFELADEIKAKAQEQARAKAAHARLKRLEKLAQNEESAWAVVETLLGQKTGAAYEEATKRLLELRELADYQRQVKRFQTRFKALCETYGKSVALMKRFQSNGLLVK
jgi:hypothetical protein